MHRTSVFCFLYVCVCVFFFFFFFFLLLFYPHLWQSKSSIVSHICCRLERSAWTHFASWHWLRPAARAFDLTNLYSSCLRYPINTISHTERSWSRQDVQGVNPILSSAGKLHCARSVQRPLCVHNLSIYSSCNTLSRGFCAEKEKRDRRKLKWF